MAGGTGGLGGGGNGGANGTAGVNATGYGSGGGGGGGLTVPAAGGSGSNGIIIIRYLTSGQAIQKLSYVDYDVKKINAFLIPLRYFTKTTTQITKSIDYISRRRIPNTFPLSYVVQPVRSVTSTLRYRVKSKQQKTESVDYVIKRKISLSSISASYLVSLAQFRRISFQTNYDVKNTENIQRSIDYLLLSRTQNSLSLNYLFGSTRNLSFSLSYAVIGSGFMDTGAIFNRLKFNRGYFNRIKINRKIRGIFSIGYKVFSQSQETESVDYDIVRSPLLYSYVDYWLKQKDVSTSPVALNYDVSTVQSLSKTLSYLIQHAVISEEQPNSYFNRLKFNRSPFNRTNQAAPKLLFGIQYMVLNNHPVSTTISYLVRTFVIQIEKSLSYMVRQSVQIQRELDYSVFLINQSTTDVDYIVVSPITKTISLTYILPGDVPDIHYLPKCIRLQCRLDYPKTNSLTCRMDYPKEVNLSCRLKCV